MYRHMTKKVGIKWQRKQVRNQIIQTARRQNSTQRLSGAELLREALMARHLRRAVKRQRKRRQQLQGQGLTRSMRRELQTASRAQGNLHPARDIRQTRQRARLREILRAALREHRKRTVIQAVLRAAVQRAVEATRAEKIRHLRPRAHLMKHRHPYHIKEVRVSR